MIPRITGARLKNRSLKIGGTHGLDGWRKEEISAMPNTWWEAIADLFQAFENGAIWPEGLAQASIPLIAKESGSHKPLDQRPIAVLSTIYRTWAGLRFKDLERWRETWTPKELYGGEPEREALQAYIEMGMELENAHLSNSPLIAIFLDYAKYFDSIPWTVVWGLAEWWGIPPEIIRAEKSFYSALSSRFKINGHYGKPWWRTNSFAQGCPLSILWANLLGAAWTIILTARIPGAGKSIFIDDKALRTKNRVIFLEALKLNSLFDRLTGQKLNITKVMAMATTQEDRNWLRKIMIDNNHIQVDSKAIYLGAQLDAARKIAQSKAYVRIDKAENTLDDICRICASKQTKISLVEGKLIPQITYAAALKTPPPKPPTGLLGKS